MRTKSVVITGASSGIGHACALRLAQLGYRVFAGVRSADAAETLRHRGVTPISLDVRDPESLSSAAATVGEALGGNGLQALVNNAGIVVSGPLEFLEIEELRRQFEVNVLGPVAVTQRFFPFLRKAHGRIVNMGSTGGRLALPFLGPYCASKFALSALTDALRMELRPWGIAVSLVEPANISTPIWEKAIPELSARVHRLPPEARRLYDPYLAAVREFAEGQARTASSVGLVVEAVLHALSAKRPRTRYLVGRGARMQAALGRHFPDRLRDRLILGHVKLL